MTFFGDEVVPLSTGNVVVLGRGGTGSVSLWNGTTGELISTLIGSSESDFVDSQITVLANGNFVIAIPKWDNGLAVDAGAVTWGSGVAGVSGTVSSANSLVGTTTDDRVGDFGDLYIGKSIWALSNGNYVVVSPVWDNGAAVNAGAITWGNGLTGVSGEVSAAISLVGSTAYDSLGAFYERPNGVRVEAGIQELANGNYVVASIYWSNGAAIAAGAVTWGSGTSGVRGVVSATNSLVGTSSFDTIGMKRHLDEDYPFTIGGIELLPNGNYLVKSPLWSNGAAFEAGAVTWGSGTTGVFGPITSANSLVGDNANDRIGVTRFFYQEGIYFDDAVEVLPNGNYLVASPNWDNGLAIDAGAVTWGSGTSGVTGVISAANSLVGTSSYDWIGGQTQYAEDDPNDDDPPVAIGGVELLPNGNYLVKSPNWNNGSVVDVGAVTWGDGSVVGPVTSVNSLVGDSAYDRIGTTKSPGISNTDHHRSTVEVFPNGNYVVVSPQWDNGVDQDVGAVTFGRGDSGVTGKVSQASNGVVGFLTNSGLELTRDDPDTAMSAYFVREGRIVVGSQVDGFPAQGFSTSVVDGALRINGPSNRAADIRVTRDAARSRYVVRTYNGNVVDQEFRFATSSVTGGLVATLGGRADRFDASGVSLAATIRGGAGNDTIIGSMGNDSIEGALGDDLISGRAGRDQILGGDGRDTIRGGAGADIVSGGNDNDEIYGGDSSISAGDGNDKLHGDGGDDSIVGGLGNDTLCGDVGKDSLFGNAGTDTIIGDDSSASLGSSSLNGDLLNGNEGDDTILGGIGNDTLLGGKDNDKLLGEAGDDLINGQGGNDRIDGGSGNDSLRGAAGADWLFGGLGNDKLAGGLGDDWLVGGAGNDLIHGGELPNNAAGIPGGQPISGSDGNDLLQGGTGTDNVNGGSGRNVVTSEGPDTFPNLFRRGKGVMGRPSR